MKLNFSVKPTRQISAIQSPVIVILIPEHFSVLDMPSALPGSLSTHVQTALKDRDFKPSAGYCLLMRHLPRVASPRILLLGVGQAQPQDFDRSMQVLATKLKELKLAKAVLYLGCLNGAADEQQLVQMLLAVDRYAYEYVYTRTRAPRIGVKPQAMKEDELDLSLMGLPAVLLKRAVLMVRGIGQGVRLAREWGNRPANYATPAMIANVAKDIARHSSQMNVQIFERKDVEKMKMGAFLAVAKGSQEPLRFIVLNYKGGPSTQAPVALVGKGITFDSGGISLKPAAGMDEMKFDMCGASSVLGAFQALAILKPSVNVVGVIACCENLPSGQALKPGDVVTSMSGRTIEVLNTDAEGRLVLCDALTYVRKFKPQAIVDVATLTGACVVALGKVRSGLFSNDIALQSELWQAGEVSGDKCWPMPVDKEYKAALDTKFADIANVGGRDGGAITAALFLKTFVEDCPWAHLDIAGSAWDSGDAKGATGRPVALLTHFILGRVKPRARGRGHGHGH